MSNPHLRHIHLAGALFYGLNHNVFEKWSEEEILEKVAETITSIRLDIEWFTSQQEVEREPIYWAYAGFCTKSFTNMRIHDARRLLPPEAASNWVRLAQADWEAALSKAREMQTQMEEVND